MNLKAKITSLLQIFLLACLGISISYATPRDLAEIKEAGVLSNIGVPYANFVAQYAHGDGLVETGLDVELMQGFAAHLGVEYQYVPAKWTNLFGLLTGKNGLYIDNNVVYGEQQPIQGDVIANGATTLAWRKEIVDFSDDYFPSAVWLISRADSDLMPIRPSGKVEKDIQQVKSLMDGRDILAMKQSCLDPDLYDLHLTGANVILPIKERKLNEMIPAILNNDAESTLLDVADTLIALEKWPGEIKVIGPVSTEQTMAVAFNKKTPELRKAFNAYLKQMKVDGSYKQLVQKYYPAVFYFYPDFFTVVN